MRLFFLLFLIILNSTPHSLLPTSIPSNVHWKKKLDPFVFAQSINFIRTTLKNMNSVSKCFVQPNKKNNQNLRMLLVVFNPSLDHGGYSLHNSYNRFSTHLFNHFCDPCASTFNRLPHCDPIIALLPKRAAAQWAIHHPHPAGCWLGELLSAQSHRDKGRLNLFNYFSSICHSTSSFFSLKNRWIRQLTLPLVED